MIGRNLLASRRDEVGERGLVDDEDALPTGVTTFAVTRAPVLCLGTISTTRAVIGGRQRNEIEVPRGAGQADPPAVRLTDPLREYRPSRSPGCVTHAPIAPVEPFEHATAAGVDPSGRRRRMMTVGGRLDARGWWPCVGSAYFAVFPPRLVRTCWIRGASTSTPGRSPESVLDRGAGNSACSVANSPRSVDRDRLSLHVRPSPSS
jgi:hypothetical protein